LGNSGKKMCRHTVNHVAKIGLSGQKIGDVSPCRRHVTDMLPTFPAKLQSTLAEPGYRLKILSVISLIVVL
jgi:hypothetical protein